jgi:hypothetical protein
MMASSSSVSCKKLDLLLLRLLSSLLSVLTSLLPLLLHVPLPEWEDCRSLVLGMLLPSELLSEMVLVELLAGLLGWLLLSLLLVDVCTGCGLQGN